MRQRRLTAAASLDAADPRDKPAKPKPVLPLVIAGKARGALVLTACDRQAMRLGLKPGLTLADARARVPDLDVVEADSEADRRFLLRLAEASDRFTPSVALDEPHGLVFDVTGSAHLFGDEAGLASRVTGFMKRLGVGVRFALAGTPYAARAMARFGRGGVIPPDTDEYHVRPLPVLALDMPAETALALRRAGLKTLGDLADRPSAVLSARFGEALAVRLSATLGRHDPRITPLRAPPPCCAARHFAEPMLHMAQLEDTLAALLTDVAAQLDQLGQGGRVFEASFFRSDGAARRITVETGRPSRDGDAILRLFRERLGALADPIDPGFGFDSMRLGVSGCAPLAPSQAAFGRRVAEDGEVAHLVDRLSARLGRDRVLRFVPIDTHQPERAATAIPAQQSAKPVPWYNPYTEEPPLRPVQLFDPPHPIDVPVYAYPDGPPARFLWRRVSHAVVRAEGPERLAPEWWGQDHGKPTRDYYRVEDEDGRRFWIYRAGLHTDEAARPHWYIHGLFA